MVRQATTTRVACFLPTVLFAISMATRQQCALRQIGHRSSSGTASPLRVRAFSPWTSLSPRRPSGLTTLQSSSSKTHKPLHNCSLMGCPSWWTTSGIGRSPLSETVNSRWSSRTAPAFVSAPMPATDLTLPGSKINIVVMEPAKHPSPVDDLKPVWLRLRGVPPQLRSEDKLSAALVMMGKPILVDALSLIKYEDLMVKMSLTILKIPTSCILCTKLLTRSTCAPTFFMWTNGFYGHLDSANKVEGLPVSPPVH